MTQTLDSSNTAAATSAAALLYYLLRANSLSEVGRQLISQYPIVTRIADVDDLIEISHAGWIQERVPGFHRPERFVEQLAGHVEFHQAVEPAVDNVDIAPVVNHHRLWGYKNIRKHIGQDSAGILRLVETQPRTPRRRRELTPRIEGEPLHFERVCRVDLSHDEVGAELLRVECRNAAEVVDCRETGSGREKARDKVDIIARVLQVILAEMKDHVVRVDGAGVVVAVTRDVIAVVRKHRHSRVFSSRDKSAAAVSDYLVLNVLVMDDFYRSRRYVMVIIVEPYLSNCGYRHRPRSHDRVIFTCDYEVEPSVLGYRDRILHILGMTDVGSGKLDHLHTIAVRLGDIQDIVVTDLNSLRRGEACPDRLHLDVAGIADYLTAGSLRKGCRVDYLRFFVAARNYERRQEYDHRVFHFRNSSLLRICEHRRDAGRA